MADTPKTDEERLEEELIDTALNPASIHIDGQSITTQSITDLIKLDEYLSKKRSRRSKVGPIFQMKCHLPEGRS